MKPPQQTLTTCTVTYGFLRIGNVAPLHLRRGVCAAALGNVLFIVMLLAKQFQASFAEASGHLCSTFGNPASFNGSLITRDLRNSVRALARQRQGNWAAASVFCSAASGNLLGSVRHLRNCSAPLAEQRWCICRATSGCLRNSFEELV